MMISRNTRYASFIVLVCMIIATFTFLLPVSADGVAEKEDDRALMTTDEILATYLTKVYESKEAKLATMEYKKSSPNGDYRLYMDPYSGEVAVECVSTGEILLSNPYDVATVSASTVREEILSQVVVKFKDLDNKGIERTFHSYTESALYGQINIKNTKSGVRVEYTLGKESNRSLVPRWIEATRFENEIMAYIDPEEESYIYEKILSFYSLKDPNSEAIPADVIDEYGKLYPCTNQSYYTEEISIGLDEYDKNTLSPSLVSQITGLPKDKMAIYVIDTKAETSERELNTLEGYLKRFCPHYNFEQVEYDHELTGYVGTASANAVFYLSIEYSITDEGLVATVPGNSLSYDEEKYELVNITVLPYMGTSNGNDKGYTFVPDGSGTIIRNEDIDDVKSAYTLTGQVYGSDYAYHKLSSDGKSQVFTAPVFGVVSQNTKTEQGAIISQREELVYERDGAGNILYDPYTNEPYYVFVLDDDGNPLTYPDGSPVIKTEMVYEYEEITTTAPSGVFAIITEGEALAYITSNHGCGLRHNYNSAYAVFYPRSSDSYNLGDSISVEENTEWTITSDRKYTGRFTIKYVMLSDNENAKYESSYVGMAKAYRDHLVNNGFISKITDAKDNIPLYLETFGMIEVQEMVMTIPTWVDKPLSTFDDVMTMYNRLSDEAGINNVKVKLTGFTEGGWLMTLAPTTVKFEKVVGGKDGYNELISDAEKTDGLLEIFPEFDFANVSAIKFFDKYSDSRDSVRTVDDRYTSKRVYSSVYQSFQYVGSLCVSPAAYERMYDHFTKAMNKFSKGGVSVSSLGSDVNTDFNEDNPLNREDSKGYTVDLLSKLKGDYNGLMVNQGNAYAWPYVDHILNVALDGSNYIRTSESIPFIGMVLHGYINIAGAPTNMQGNIEREMLKIIENGASPYYVLVMQNSSELKEYYMYSEYYSIDFENWYEDVVETYNVINDALKDVQMAEVTDHKFVSGERVLTAQEIAVREAEYEKQLAAYKSEREQAYETYLKKLIQAENAKLEAEAAGEEYTGEEIAPFEYKEFSYSDTVDLTIDDGTIVYMTYENGIGFILNYNAFGVRVEINGTTYDLDEFAFVKIQAQ